MEANSGVSPQIKKIIKQRDKAMSGDLSFNVTSKGTAPSAGTGFSAIDFEITLEDSAGNVQDWFNKTITMTALAVTTVGDGVATQSPATTCVMKNGVGTVSVTGTATWASGDTFTVEVASATILGYTVSSANLLITCSA